jgi:hypothetical protein
MDRALAHHRLWQFKPFTVHVQADAFVRVEPIVPEGVEVAPTPGGFTIRGTYGFDCFTDNRFVVRVDGALQTYTRYADIPAVIDNVVEFVPDDTHDITFSYHFLRDGEPLVHTHWVHHETHPWIARLHALVARETNGGWSACSHPRGRRRHPPLLPHEPRRGFARRLLQWHARLQTR